MKLRIVLLIIMTTQAVAATHEEPSNPFIPRLPDDAITVQHTNSGKSLSINVHKMQVRTLLHALAKLANQNMVISDGVQGEISLSLHDVSLEQALNITLETRGLTKRKINNVLVVTPFVAQQQYADLQSTHAPIQTTTFSINHAKVADVAAILKNNKNTLLSSRGNVNFDNRTNTLWVQDTEIKLHEIRNFIKQIDAPSRQVLIEARIVSLDKGFERDLGIRFGLSQPGQEKAAKEASPANVDLIQRLKVDLPSFSVNALGGSMGLALAKLGKGILLDLELSALESEGYAKIIATPRLLTTNQKEALIQAGEEIPYQQATENGGTSVTFKKAVLSLKVIPQITAQGRIILDLSVSQDKRGPEVLLGVPTINTQQLTTQVLIDNGQTIVLGGIYQKIYTNSVQRVPFLSMLPIVGALFKHTLRKEEQRELLIFVTPKIINYEQDT